MNFTVNGKNYASGKLDAFQQDAVARRLLPLIPSMVTAWQGMAPLIGSSERDFDLALECAKLIGPFLDAYAKMPDDAVQFIQTTALRVVQIQQGDAWANLWIERAGLAFPNDIDALDLNEIVFNVLKDNLSNFFSGLARRGWLGTAAGPVA